MPHLRHLFFLYVSSGFQMDFLIIHQRPYRAVVPHLFGTRDQFCGRQSWTRGWGLASGRLKSVTFLCTLFLLLLHQLDLRSSGIRSRRLETPVLRDSLPHLRHVLLCSLFISLSLGLQNVFSLIHHRPCRVNIMIMIST